MAYRSYCTTVLGTFERLYLPRYVDTRDDANPVASSRRGCCPKLWLHFQIESRPENDVQIVCPPKMPRSGPLKLIIGFAVRKRSFSDFKSLP